MGSHNSDISGYPKLSSKFFVISKLLVIVKRKKTMVCGIHSLGHLHMRLLKGASEHTWNLQVPQTLDVHFKQLPITTHPFSFTNRELTFFVFWWLHYKYQPILVSTCPCIFAIKLCRTPKNMLFKWQEYDKPTMSRQDTLFHLHLHIFTENQINHFALSCVNIGHLFVIW